MSNPDDPRSKLNVRGETEAESDVEKRRRAVQVLQIVVPVCTAAAISSAIMGFLIPNGRHS